MNELMYSVVVPVYCADNALEKLHERITAFFKGKYSFEIIYVDDCSSDNSWEVLKKIKQTADVPVKIIRLSKNFGQHAATICGFKYAAGNFVVSIDDDLEVDPPQIQALIEKQKEKNSDLVYGVYRKLNQPFFRGIFTKTYKLLSKLEGPKKGQGSSFRLLRKELAQKLVTNHKQFVFIDELCLWYTQKFDFVNVESNKNYIPKSRYKAGSLFKLTTTVIMFSSTIPLRFVTFIGMVLAASNFLIGTLYIVKKFYFKIDVEGYTSLIVSILFSTGLIILCLGIIAQYISQSLKVLNNAPCYSEDEVQC